MGDFDDWLQKLREKARLYWRDFSDFFCNWRQGVSAGEDSAVEARIKFLRNVDLLEDLRYSQYRSMLKIFHERNYSKGEVIFCEGDPASALYLIRKGRVGLSRPGLEESEVVYLDEYEMFGELALGGEHRRTMEARAQAPLEVMVLFRQDFEKFVYRNPTCGISVLLKLTGLLSERFQENREVNLRLMQELEELKGSDETD